MLFDFFIASLPILFIISVNLMIKIAPYIKNQLDVLSGGTFDDLYDTYALIFSHMDKNPDQWKFGKDSARFPKSGGAAIISITKENDKRNLQIAIDHINDGKFSELRGYFNNVFRRKINDSFSAQSSEKMATVLFPNKDLIMLTDESKNQVNDDFIQQLKVTKTKDVIHL